MPKLSEMFPSKYLKASDCDDGDLVLTMSDVKMETVGQGEDADYKPVVYFHEVKQGLVLNKTNSVSIAKLHGDDTDLWDGKKIALFATEVDFSGKQVLALRVRLKAPKSGGKPATAQAVAATPRPPGPGPELTTKPADDEDDTDDQDIPF